MRLLTSATIAITLCLFSTLTNAECFTTTRDAIDAAFQQIPAHSRTEFAGVVYQDGECITYTEPQGNNSDDSFNLKIAVPHGSKLLALYHNHPGMGQMAKYFSITDIKVSRQMNLASYIRVYGNEIKVINPGDRTLSDASVALNTCLHFGKCN